MAQIPADQSALPTPQAAMSVASPRQESRMSMMLRTMPAQADQQFAAQMQQEQNRLNITQSEDITNQARAIQQNLTLGDNGFKKLQGSAAVNQPVLKNYLQQFDDATKPLVDGLQNDEQRQMVEPKIQAIRSQYAGDILGHLAQASDVYHKQVTGATIDTETQDAALHYDNPASIQGNLARIGAAVDSETNRQGLDQNNPDDAKIIADAKMKAVSGLHAAVVSTAIDKGNTNYAQKWLDQFKGQMDTKTLEGLQGALKAGVTKDQALSTALDVKSQTSDISQQEKILDDQFKAGKINADVHYSALQQLRADFSQQREVDAQQAKSVLGNIGDMKLKNPNATINDIPAGTMAFIKKQGLLQNVIGIMDSTDNRSSPGLVNDLRQRIYLPDGDPKKISDMSQVVPFIGKGLSFTDTEHMRTELANASNPDGSPFAKQVNNVKTTARKMITGNMSTMALQHPEMTEEAAYRFGNDLDQKIAQYRKDGKDVHSLFTPGSPDYVLNINRVAGYMPSEQNIVVDKSASINAGKSDTSAQSFPTATNPKTGERMILKGGKWQPMQ